MDIALRFHDTIESCNILRAPTSRIGNFLDTHPTLYKIVLVINHLFRAAMMIGLMFVPSIPKPISLTVCFVGSLFYRLTVEKNCAYKFALPAFAGTVAFMIAFPSLINMINGVAFVTPVAGILACVSFIPLVGYGAYVLLTVSYADLTIDAQHAKLTQKEEFCCDSKEDISPKIHSNSI